MELIELAKELDGSEIYLNFTSEKKQWLKDRGIVVVTGQSDDLVEFDGAIEDEVGAYGGTEIAIMPSGLVLECEEACDHCPNEQLIKTAPKIIAKFSHEDFTWHIDATFSRFVIFTLLEDGEKHTRGIAFYLSAVTS